MQSAHAAISFRRRVWHWLFNRSVRLYLRCGGSSCLNPVNLIINSLNTPTMSLTNTMMAMRHATRGSARLSLPATAIPARRLHGSTPVLKAPPLKGPVPTEQAEEVKEGGDGFLGVSQVSQNHTNLSSLVKSSSERQILSSCANHVRRYSTVPKPPRKRASYPVQTTHIPSLSGVESTYTRRSPIASFLRSGKSIWKQQGNTIPS